MRGAGICSRQHRRIKPSALFSSPLLVYPLVDQPFQCRRDTAQSDDESVAQIEDPKGDDGDDAQQYLPGDNETVSEYQHREDGEGDSRGKTGGEHTVCLTAIGI
jgi:hypothetical protein